MLSHTHKHEVSHKCGKLARCWRDSPVGKALALQVQGPKFRLQYPYKIMM